MALRLCLKARGARALGWVGALGCLAYGTVGLAAENGQYPVVDASTSSGPTEEARGIPPPPHGFDSKRSLTIEDLRRKEERGYFTGLPLWNSDPNTGLGFGARAYYYYNGERSDPLFAYTPYLHRVFAQVFATTKGLQFHWLDYDAPAIFDSPYRIRSQLIFLRNTSQNFYGIGAQSLEPLTYTGAGRTFSTWQSYDEALRQVRGDGTTLARYNQYDLVRPIWLASIERTFFYGLLRQFFGFSIARATLRDYTGDEVDAVDADGEDVRAPQGDTLLTEQCRQGLLGCDGGWDNTLRFGLSLDTRDFEPDPNSGAFVDFAMDLGTPVLGSDYTYSRVLVSARYFFSPAPRWVDLVVAARGTLQAQSRGTPFTSLNTLTYTEDTRTGLGGHRTLRGFRQDRFVGNVLTLANFELRWTFYRFTLLQQKLGFILVPFLDTGRVYDPGSRLSFADWRTGGGAALRISWNLATIVSVDYGVSAEDSGLYINFNHQF